MKVKKLIEELSKFDPDTEVCVGNLDIVYFDEMPSYYDGTLQVITRDSNGKPIKAKFLRSGRKIKILTESISDALERYSDLEIDFSDLDPETQKSYKKSLDKDSIVNHNIHQQCEWDLFWAWAKNKAAQINSTDEYELELAAKEFFDANCDYRLSFPENIKNSGSYAERRKLQFEQEVEIIYKGLEWEFKKKK